MKKPLKIALIVSLGWWLLVILDQIRLSPACTPDDSFCNSGNTVSGDVIWGSVLAFLSLSLAWSTILIFVFIAKVLSNHRQKPAD